MQALSLIVALVALVAACAGQHTLPPNVKFVNAPQMTFVSQGVTANGSWLYLPGSGSSPFLNHLNLKQNFNGKKMVIESWINETNVSGKATVSILSKSAGSKCSKVSVNGNCTAWKRVSGSTMVATAGSQTWHQSCTLVQIGTFTYDITATTSPSDSLQKLNIQVSGNGITSTQKIAIVQASSTPPPRSAFTPPKCSSTEGEQTADWNKNFFA